MSQVPATISLGPLVLRTIAYTNE